MRVADKVVVVTGAASGIGRALCERFAAEGARGVVVSDIDAEGAARVADAVGGMAIPADAGNRADVHTLVVRAQREYGQIDLFCCNAGIFVEGGVEVTDEQGQKIWQVNSLGIVHAAREVLPGMLERGLGGLLITASAAGLVTQIGSIAYAATKHAAVSIAEWLAITYGDRGLEVFCLCPLGVNTGMMEQFIEQSAIARYLKQSALEPEQVAAAVVEAMEAGRFLIVPHPEVVDFFRRKADDYDRWLAGMRRFQERFGD